MRKLVFVAGLILLIGVAFAAAETHDQPDMTTMGEPDVDDHPAASPGWILPDSALYGLAVAKDNMMMRAGLSSPGAIAEKRAAQAREMVERGNPDATTRASQEMYRAVDRAGPDDQERINRAMASFQDAMTRMEQRIQDAPNEEARQGMQTALQNMQGAMSNMEDARERMQDARDRAPDEPGDVDDLTPEQAQERISAAEDLREDARDRVADGNDHLDNENYEEARQAYSDAEDRFDQALDRLADVDEAQFPEAAELRNDLQNARSGAENLELSVQAYMDGNDGLADQYAQQADNDFSQTRRGGVQ